MKTVFVIGAGANVEIGMPSGNGLKQEIIDRLDYSFMRTPETEEIDKLDTLNTKPGGDIAIYDFFVGYGMDGEDLALIGSNIRKALPLAISVDNFLDAVQKDEARYNDSEMTKIVAKMAIVSSIQAAERQSRLYSLIQKYYGDEKLQETWYPLFFQKITEGCGINDFIERLNDISFIIFNYDRCFETYMIYAIETYYHIQYDSALEIVDKMNIIHPYGMIGDINKRYKDKGGSGVRLSIKNPLYGEPFTETELYSRADNIRTFSEYSEETNKEQTSIKNIITQANRIIFLGFAYHQINLDLLFKHSGDVDSPENSIRCYGTGYGISENDRKYIQDILMRIYPQINYCDISGDTCTQFFNNFWHRLSFQQ